MAKDNDQEAMEREQPEAQQEPAQEVQEATSPGQIIIDDSGYTPKLDPNTTDFDFDAWRMMIGALGEAGVIGTFLEKLDGLQRTVQDGAIQVLREQSAIDHAKVLVTAYNKIAEALSTSISQIATAAGVSDELRAFAEAAKDDFAERAEITREVLPYLQSELDAAKADPQYKDLTIEEMMQTGFDADGKPTKSPFRTIIDRAIKRMEGMTLPTEQPPGRDAETATLPRITYHNSKQLKTVTDKFANVFFSMTAPPPKTQRAAVDGQLAMIPLRYEGHNSKKEITLYYDYEYNEEALSVNGIPKGFLSYDFFVAQALDNLFDHGNEIVSYSKILEEMGVPGRPGTEHLTKLAASLQRGATTTTYINDKEVQAAWGNKDKYTEIIGQVFPITIRNDRYLASGLVADGVVKINGHTPFRIVADSIGHVTKWDKRILQLYTGRRTARYWNIMQFLIREIGWMRNEKSKRNTKILYTALYKHNGDKSTSDKQHTRDMLYRLLDEVFIPTGYIKSYKEDNSTSPGVILILADRTFLPE